MNRRYDTLHKLKVGNIGDYNRSLGKQKKDAPDSVEGLEPLPYLVIVINEFAELASADDNMAEQIIAHMALFPHSLGIHFVIATQNPNKNVITAQIKQTFPCCISFRLPKQESMNVLNTEDAEHLLLGQGEMLLKSGNGQMQLLNVAHVTKADLMVVADFWKKQGSPRYEVDLSDWNNPDDVYVAEDSLYQPVVDFAFEQGAVSADMIARHFYIRYDRAARFVKQMQEDEIISEIPVGSENMG